MQHVHKLLSGQLKIGNDLAIYLLSLEGSESELARLWLNAADYHDLTSLIHLFSSTTVTILLRTTCNHCLVNGRSLQQRRLQ